MLTDLDEHDYQEDHESPDDHDDHEDHDVYGDHGDHLDHLDHDDHLAVRTHIATLFSLAVHILPPWFLFVRKLEVI